MTAQLNRYGAVFTDIARWTHGRPARAMAIDQIFLGTLTAFRPGLMLFLAIIATVKDWAELLHALAWPIVALVALYLFRNAIQDILRRIPFERATSVKARGLGEVQMKAEQKVAAKVKLLPPPEPKRTDTIEKADE